MTRSCPNKGEAGSGDAARDELQELAFGRRFTRRPVDKFVARFFERLQVQAGAQGERARRDQDLLAHLLAFGERLPAALIGFPPSAFGFRPLRPGARSFPSKRGSA